VTTFRTSLTQKMVKTSFTQGLETMEFKMP
jgi:hypothetical protein